jgi:hypothetical protein
MGYNIEVSFNVIKNSSVTELQNMVKEFAEDCGCNYYYEDYEYETNVQFKRNHCVMTMIFSQYNLLYLLKFIKFIRNKQELYLELIYDDDNRKILYASQYYITQRMNKLGIKNFKKERNERKYSDDETMILNTIKKKLK